MRRDNHEECPWLSSAKKAHLILMDSSVKGPDVNHFHLLSAFSVPGAAFYRHDPVPLRVGRD